MEIDLDQTLKAHLRRRKGFRFRIYVKIIITISLVVHCILMTGVAPAVARVFEEMDVALPAVVTLFLKISQYWWQFILFTLVNSLIIYKTKILDRTLILILEGITFLIFLGFDFTAIYLMVSLITGGYIS